MRNLRNLLLLLLLAAPAFADPNETLRITHRFDWRRSVDQKYQGLVHGYLTGSWKTTASSNAGWSDVEARYYQASESRRDNVLTEKAIEAERLARFRIDPAGRMTGFVGDGVPLYRNYPAPLPADAGPGTVWTGTGEVVGDFLGTGVWTRVPILVEYRWAGEGSYLGTKVIQVNVQYALRYQAGADPQGDPAIARIEGSRKGAVSYDPGTRKVVFLRETTDERYKSTSGSVVGNQGFLLTYYDGVPALGTSDVVQRFQNAIAGKPSVPATSAPDSPPSALPASSGPALDLEQAPPPALRLTDGEGAGEIPDVRVEADPRGVKLTLDNLKFVADQATLLPGEAKRLASIVSLLKSVLGRTLLVVGHTADVGSAASQQTLSVDRALAIVEKLKAAGLPPSSLLYEGRGGREPVAPNDTEANKARNRRVEIIVLDQ